MALGDHRGVVPLVGQQRSRPPLLSKHHGRHQRRRPPGAPRWSPLIATNGFEYYVGVIVRLFGSACVYGLVLKTRRNDRVVRVERRVKIGTASRLKAALWESEDSATLNTSFVERLNLTIRQGSAYLRRRTPVAPTSSAGTSNSCAAITISSGRIGR